MNDVINWIFGYVGLLVIIAVGVAEWATGEGEWE